MNGRLPIAVTNQFMSPHIYTRLVCAEEVCGHTAGHRARDMTPCWTCVCDSLLSFTAGTLIHIQGAFNKAPSLIDFVFVYMLS